MHHQIMGKVKNNWRNNWGQSKIECPALAEYVETKDFHLRFWQ